MSKQSMIEHAKKFGRKDMSAYVLGEIEAVLSYEEHPYKTRVKNAIQSIKNYDEVRNDEELPWDWAEIQRNNKVE